MNYKELIKIWKLDRGVIASKMGMPLGTFKTKFSENLPAYNFTQAEEERLKKVLKELASAIEVLE